MKHMRIFLMLALATMNFSLIGCGDGRPDLEGDWAINIPATLDNAKKIGGSERDIERVRENIEGGQISIDKTDLKISTKGDSVSLKIPYRLTGKYANCFNLEVKGLTHSYCLQGGDLSVHDPTTKLIVVYSRR